MVEKVERGERLLAEQIAAGKAATESVLGMDAIASEVTPPMIQAGCAELAHYNDDYESAEDAVVRIYTAMREAMAAGSGPR